MHPEWLVDVPPDLASSWFVMPRPEGDRCLVIAARGETTARLRNGRVKAVFPSQLPGGCRSKTGDGKEGFSILDCVFCSVSKVYFVMDTLCWNGHAVSDSDTEFRLFWTASKLAEVPVAATSRLNRFAFVAVPVYAADGEGIKASYSELGLPFRRDGLLFSNKESTYTASEYGNPLVMLWKDDHCSRYALESQDTKEPSLHVVSLLLHQDGSLVTNDQEPLTLGNVNREAVEEYKLAPGEVLKFAVQGVDIDSSQVSDARFLGKAPPGKKADSWSKVVFQHQLRCGVGLGRIAVGDLCAPAGAGMPTE
jgi:snurportin-1